jgi:site-specific recombinase XerC
VEPLQRIMTRARRFWKVALPDEPKWSKLKLAEPEERVREVHEHEEQALFEAVREDYQAVVEFARESGLRMNECLLRKGEVNLTGGFIETTGKGRRKVRRPITTEMRRILMAEMANPTDHVFTYVAQRDRRGKNGWKAGDRRPITESGLKTLWRRARYNEERALPADLKFHDMRHDFGTKLLRATGNLKLVQKAIGHARIETTTRYAHVLNDEVRQGMETASRRRKESRKKSRSPHQGSLNL